jgi:WD40 repeat protein
MPAGALGAHDAPTRPAEPPARGVGPATTAAAPSPAAALPSRIGRYHIKRLIGAGGMGAVYEAVQEQPRRVVALKVMKQGIASRSALRRFEYEAQLLARLRHPGIAQVYEAGTHFEPGGMGGVGGGTVPFFAMEYIPGARPITEHARARRLSTRERLELFCKVCDAVHFGHTKGIIHRDLKPANILVESSLAVAHQGEGGERVGQPKIIDFGVARATDSDLAVTTLQTEVGQLVGTLQYMSPEQASLGGPEADPLDLDVRSDVYALGVVLYELLCERLPYDVSRSAIFEATRVIREQAPARLSAVNRTLRGDIETITLKALEKDRDRRYRSAADLADDIRRYLRSEPIHARPPSVVYQARMLARRHRPLVVAALLVFAALSAGLVVATVFAVRAERQRAEAQASAYVARLAAAQSALLMHDTGSARTQLDDAPASLRDWEWEHLRSRLDLSLADLDGGDGPVYGCAIAPDCATAATGGANGVARLWDLRTAQSVAAWRAHGAPVFAAAFSPDGRLLATGAEDGRITVWDVGGRTAVSEPAGHGGAVRCLRFSPSGELFSGGDDRVIRRWDARSGEARGVLEGHAGPVHSIAISGDGAYLASTAPDLTARLWDLEAGAEVARFGDTGALFAVAIGRARVRQMRHDGPGDGPAPKMVWRTLMAYGGVNTMIRVVDVEDRRPVATLQGHEFRVNSLGFLPDGSGLVSASWDRTVRLWSTDDWRPRVVLRGHRGGVLGLSVGSDGNTIVSTSFDRTMRVWEIPCSGDVPAFKSYWEEVGSAAFAPDGRRYATGSLNQPVRVWDSMTGECVGSIMVDRRASALAFAGDLLAIGEDTGQVHVWETVRQARTAQVAAHGGAVVGLAAVNAGAAGAARLLSVGEDGAVRAWRLPGGESDGVLALSGDVPCAAAASEGGRTVAVGGRAGTVWLIDGAALRVTGQFRAAGEGLRAVALPPAGDRVAVATDGGGGVGGVRVYGLGGAVLDESRPVSSVTALAFIAGGRRLLAGLHDGSITVRDPARHEDLLSLMGHRGSISVFAVSPDGSTVVSGSSDEWFRVWGTAPARDRQAAARAARESRGRLRPMVQALFEEHVTTANVVNRLMADRSLSESDRGAALVIARTWVSNIFAANMDSWQAVRVPGRTSAAYEQALRRIDVVLGLVPEDGNFLNTKGVALYRLGRDEEAVGALRRADALNSASGAAGKYPYGPFPADHAFLALALQRLGREAEAAAALTRFRALAAEPKWRADEETLAFAREVDAVFGPPPAR